MRGASLSAGTACPFLHSRDGECAARGACFISGIACPLLHLNGGQRAARGAFCVAAIFSPSMHWKGRNICSEGHPRRPWHCCPVLHSSKGEVCAARGSLFDYTHKGGSGTTRSGSFPPRTTGPVPVECAVRVISHISLGIVDIYANTERFRGLEPLSPHLCPLSVP